MRFILLAAIGISGLTWAQPAPAPSEGATPPPLVPAQPETSAPGTPPPPSHTPGFQTQPYSPYGSFRPNPSAQPPVEIGLMMSELAFGALTAAASSLIPYFLFLKPLGAAGGTIDAGVANLIFVLVFSAVPLTVAQTQVSLANGSRYYESESWPAALSGLATQGAVIGLYYLLGAQGGGSPAELTLLIGTVAMVPIVEMAVINLTKQPRLGGLMRHDPRGGWSLGLPVPTPHVVESRSGLSVGLQVPLLQGLF